MDSKSRKRDKKLKAKVQQSHMVKQQGSASQKLHSKMSESLKSSKFRFLNEQLYKSPSKDAAAMFKESPTLFDDYHEGYRNQVEKWPKNPLDLIVGELQKPKYRNADIGDFGCGEGKLELRLKASGHQGQIFSFDVGKCAEHIIQTDIASVPLEDASLDIGVFSLSLMGTNFPDFLVEANRVLKPGGTLFVAEVVSRFESVGAFVSHCREDAGFKPLKVTKLKDFFYMMIFTKKRSLG